MALDNPNRTQHSGRGRRRRSLDSRPPIYIGGEASAAGFRLAGLTVYSPSDEQLPASFQRALEQTDLLLIDVTYARRLPQKQVHEAVVSPAPLVLIVPDLLGRTPMRDLDQRLYRELGVHL